MNMSPKHFHTTSQRSEKVLNTISWDTFPRQFKQIPYVVLGTCMPHQDQARYDAARRCGDRSCREHRVPWPTRVDAQGIVVGITGDHVLPDGSERQS